MKRRRSAVVAAVVATFPSTSSDRTYTVLRFGDGTLSCNCPAWIYNKYGCYHTKSVLVAHVPVSIHSSAVAEGPRRVRLESQSDRSQ